ncbi:MAG: peptidylprolyl isomerase, partial [Chitinophagia bacterium]|nr:peptidylprolyl isomerase [Chitinophagia bacterium]
MYSVKRNLSLFAVLLFSSALLAQPKKVVADKIAAVVGDRIILQSDIKNSVADMVRRGETLPPNAECMIMEQAVVSKVMMLQA